MTRGEFSIDDFETTTSLFTDHDGHMDAAIVEIYSLMDYWVKESADNVKHFLEKNEWKSRRCPHWMWLVCISKSKSSLRKKLDTPGELERMADTGVCPPYEAVGLAQLMVARHWDRWYPFPESYRGTPHGNDFIVKMQNSFLWIEDNPFSSWDYEDSDDSSDPKDNFLNEFTERLLKIPFVEKRNDKILPVVNYKKQFWSAIRREAENLLPLLPDA